MDDEHFDPELAKRAKEEAAGPLGQELSKFPLRFALTALFGKRPVRDQPVQVNHGTITLLELGSRRIGLPCSHVLDQYREISHDNSTFFQIGREELNPLERMIDESRELDLVSIDLNDILIEETIERLGIVTRFFVPQRWPPNQLKEGDFVAFGG